jgi:hypothetical protein
MPQDEWELAMASHMPIDSEDNDPYQDEYQDELYDWEGCL